MAEIKKGLKFIGLGIVVAMVAVSDVGPSDLNTILIFNMIFLGLIGYGIMKLFGLDKYVTKKLKNIFKTPNS